MTIDGALLKRTREAQGMTQAELASQSRISMGTIRRLENGAARAHIGTIRRLGEVLDLGLDDILGLSIRLPQPISRNTPRAAKQPEAPGPPSAVR